MSKSGEVASKRNLANVRVWKPPKRGATSRDYRKLAERLNGARTKAWPARRFHSGDLSRGFNAQALGGHPSNDGFVARTVRQRTMKKGERLYRFGDSRGTYFTQQKHARGRELALFNPGKHHEFEVLKSFDALHGKVAKGYGLPGGGTQVKTGYSVRELIRMGYIRRIKPGRSTPR